MIYYLLIAFQAFCIFHIYKSRNDYYWYFIVFFVPVIGALVYFFLEIVSSRNISNANDKIRNSLNPGKKIKDLKEKLKFADSFQNKSNLADAYRENKNYPEAILFYEKALESNVHQDKHTLNKLAKCYFELKNYKKVVECADQIDLDKFFKGTICIYAISLEKCGFNDKAEIEFKKTNIRYSNYPERLEFARFLVRQENKDDAKNTLDVIISEIDNMIETNKKKYKYIYKESVKLLEQV
ncbi:tetratricopeptide repeat protein [Polaribacter dokdonensis]|uniref:TPR repeat-containing protein n=1 Tax=Polaribacter dokdonensis DSW-5 TaxID=1300348 RepID=A0A0N0CEU5_9FLAO|nr:tetratricopeptide repeat protein [Polaribacter dokdonensis]KOY50954.1 TPR repeat-containing protein [Polaribacter dokdonensis DSW-5]SEE22049.1 hypothetical protein SAMN05444353_1270 [Polaribacter dokdonensis DSW-5]